MELALREQIDKTDLKKLYPFKSHYLKLNHELNYHYVDEGEGSPVLMVHGNPTWSFYYRNLAQALCSGHRVIIPDHIGCGLSDKPQNYEYTLENHIENLKILVKFLDLKNITLVVHDWGGAIGFGVATQMPEHFSKIVILNTAAFHVNRIPFTINLCKNKIFGRYIVKKWNAFAWPATFMATKKGLKPIEKEGYLLPYNSPSNRIAIAEFVQDIPLKSDHRSYKTLKQIESKLPQLKVPKLILWGGKDFCFNDIFFNKWKSIYPDAYYKYYKDAGHYILEDEKDDVIKNIQDFVG
jgi:pimeloyl-ACP methyl ester carboxylesterase